MLDHKFQLLLVVCSFVSFALFRMEKLDIRKASSQAKSVGTIVAIIGASIMTLYKGPRVLGSNLPSDSSHHELVLSQESNWILGSLLITTTCIMSSGWNILQVNISESDSRLRK